MPYYRFRFRGGIVFGYTIRTRNLKEAWRHVKAYQLQDIMETSPSQRRVREFKPIYKCNARAWEDIKDKTIINEMKEYADELRMFIKLEGA